MSEIDEVGDLNDPKCKFVGPVLVLYFFWYMH